MPVFVFVISPAVSPSPDKVVQQQVNKLWIYCSLQYRHCSLILAQMREATGRIIA